MKNINPNKASDIFKIKPAILKDLTPFIAPILTPLFNQAIDEHSYPDPLKITKVVELYKAKERNLPPNYRPISLLPIIAKVLDTLINNPHAAPHRQQHHIPHPIRFQTKLQYNHSITNYNQPNPQAQIPKTTPPCYLHRSLQSL